MLRLTIVLILLILSCSQNPYSELVPLFDLQAYLNQLEQEWKGKTLEKWYQSGTADPEIISIPSDEFKDMLILFNPYDINKPDYADRFLLQENNLGFGTLATYTAKAKSEKIQSFSIYGERANPDSLKIQYQHKSFIGSSHHNISISAKEVSIKRKEKYVMSDSLGSMLRIRPIP